MHTPGTVITPGQVSTPTPAAPEPATPPSEVTAAPMAADPLEAAVVPTPQVIVTTPPPAEANTPPVAAATPAPTLTPARSKRKLLVPVSVVAAILVLGGGAFAFTQRQNKVALDCTPPNSSPVTTANSEQVFKNFALAVKQKNQVCADALSSGYFLKYQSTVFVGSHGKWVTYAKGGLHSLAANFSNLPNTFTTASFTSSDYTESIVTSLGSNNGFGSSKVHGLTLTYSLTDANDVHEHLNISFVSQNGKVVVDMLELKPVALDQQLQGSATGQTNTPSSDTDAKALATSDALSLRGNLESYFSDYGYYPGDVNQENFGAMNPDPSTFTLPSGYKYVYTPSPSGCTTATKTCTQFTLEVIHTSDGSVVATEISQ